MDIMKNLTIGPVKLQGISQEEAEKEAMRLLERVGLADRAQDVYKRQRQGLTAGQSRECCADMTIYGNSGRKDFLWKKQLF